MTETTPNAAAQQDISAAMIRKTRFEISRYGRGYTKAMVDAFVQDVAGLVEHLQQRLQAAEAEIQQLQQRHVEGHDEDRVIEAVDIIGNAQRTAETTVAEADAYSARVMSEAQAMYDDARRHAAQREQEAEEHVRQLTLSAQTHQEELDKQTAYLRTLRDATRTQMQKFLEGMLFHVAEEYGRAHPIAAAAAVPADETADERPAQDHLDGSPRRRSDTAEL